MVSHATLLPTSARVGATPPETATMEKSAAKELKRRASRRATLLDEIKAKQDELKELRAEDKADGFNEKALAAVVKSLRNGVQWHADQLAFELEVDTYRNACGLTTDAESADQKAREAREKLPGDDDEESVRH